MTQKVRKWLKRRGLRGGSGGPEQEAAAKAAAEKEAAAKAAADEAAAAKAAAAAAAAAAANNVVVKGPNLNDSNTSNDTVVPDAINNGVVNKVGDELEPEPEEMSASSDKQQIFKDALLKAQEAVNKALTAYL